MFKKVFEHISITHNINISGIRPLYGGDINSVFMLNCQEGNFVVKINDAWRLPKMFEAESKGLQLLRQSNSFRIPQTFAHGNIDSFSFLLLEYIPAGASNDKPWEAFSSNLVKLHKTSNPYFGLDHNNYIGSLHQSNANLSSASEFYITQRLEPQFKLASENGFNFKDLNIFYKNLSNEIPVEPPSLIHGDLWNGNHLISSKNEAVLIDPAVAFAPREMDLAMMQLFGGFPGSIFDHYEDLFPLTGNWKIRIPIWQLYYLLVHLNLFGSGYFPQVNSIVIKYH